MIKNLITFMIFIVFAINTNAQSITELEIIGNWHVLNVEGISDVPQDKKELMDSLMKAFKESTFKFGQDYRFTLDIEFSGITEVMSNVRWGFDGEESTILIRDNPSQNNSVGILMGIKVITGR